MSDLQLALAFLALAILIAVYLHGRWQERQALRQLDVTLRAGVGDALAQDVPISNEASRPPSIKRERDRPSFRVEPRFDTAWGQRPMTLDPPQVVQLDDLPVRPVTVSPGQTGRIQSFERDPAAGLAQAGRPTRGNLHSPESRLAVGVEANGSDTGGWVEDPMLDFVIELRCMRAVDGVAVLDAAGALLRMQVPLPNYVVAWDPRLHQWRLPDRFGFYADLLVGTQLAHRRHVLNEIDVSRFLANVQQMALSLDAEFDPPDVKAVVVHAAALDRVFAPFDVQLGLTLESTTGPWETRHLVDVAQRQALVQVGDLRWERRDSNGAGLFTLSSASLLCDKLALELDVPLAPAASAPLQEMLTCARSLADALSAQMVDDNGRQIDAISIASIEAQISRLYADMRAAGMEAGGGRARRLFVPPGRIDTVPIVSAQ